MLTTVSIHSNVSLGGQLHQLVMQEYDLNIEVPYPSILILGGKNVADNTNVYLCVCVYGCVHVPVYIQAYMGLSTRGDGWNLTNTRGLKSLEREKNHAIWWYK